MNVIIQPDGWEIPNEAAEIHGITTAIADDCGVPIASALSLLAMMCAKASEVVAHNLDFDYLLIRSEHARINKPCRMESVARFCTMRAATPICKLPGMYSDYKWPKLEEAYRHFTGAELVGAHDALSDVRGCAAVYFALKTICENQTPA